ncbi:MAG: energy transducer TonB [Alistipes sp.]|nr:energy transducer TonB [Alistipes sp.]
MINNQNGGEQPAQKTSRNPFNRRGRFKYIMRYVIFALVALGIVAVGAYLMFGNGEEESNKSETPETTAQSTSDVADKSESVAKVGNVATKEVSEPTPEFATVGEMRASKMNLDYGLAVEIEKRDLLVINVSRAGNLMVGDRYYGSRDIVRDGEHSYLSKEVYDFLVDIDRSNKQSWDIDAGKCFDLSKGIVLIRADEELEYDYYLKVKGEVTHAFDLYRDYVAQCVYGMPFDELGGEQQTRLKLVVPYKIDEALHGNTYNIVEEVTPHDLQFTEDDILFDDSSFDMDEDEVEIEDGEEIFTVLEDPATFQGGGLAEFRTWVMQRLKYPQIAQENGIQGNVIIEFVVDENGKIGCFKILQSPDKVLSDEAIRVLEESNNLVRGWKPGTKDGKAVKMKFVVPLTFRLLY